MCVLLNYAEMITPPYVLHANYSRRFHNRMINILIDTLSSLGAPELKSSLLRTYPVPILYRNPFYMVTSATGDLWEFHIHVHLPSPEFTDTHCEVPFNQT